MMKIKSTEADYRRIINEIILDIFQDEPFKAFNYKQLLKRFYQDPFLEKTVPLMTKIDEFQLQSFVMEELEHLAEKSEIEQVDRGKYRAIPSKKSVIGKIDITSNGNAYVMNEEYEDDIFIPRGYTLTALNGDTVKISLLARRKGGKYEGEVIEVIERAKTDYVGTVKISDRFAFLSNDGTRNGVDIFIPLNKLNGAQNGVKAVARIIEWDPESKNPSGEIIKILGLPGENDAEMDAILVEFGFPLSFPGSVEKEADEIPFRIPRKEISSRRDFRDILTFTIDPVDAKDFDDALSFQELENGNIEVGIHIADVSYYIKEGSMLEAEALERATSVYLVDRVIPMLPEKLSNLVCSLRPGEDKLCYSAVFEINDKAEIITEWFGRTIIHSKKRFSYEEAQEVIETGEGPLYVEINKLNQLAKILRKARFTKGAITFEKVEVKFKLDERGMPIDVYLKENKDSNKLIEEFMLLANRKVAEFVGKKLVEQNNKEYPFVYRIHNTPSPEKLTKFSLFASRFGHKINTNSDREVAHSFNKLMVDIKGSPEQNVLEQLAIRTMAKAIYTIDNIGHYGLAFDFYTHFTSPIRRYPDIMVHRLLDHYLKGGKPVIGDDYEAKCKHSTDMEIRASEAERASIKFKQAQYLMGREGEVFDGIISGITEWGIYVELLESKCEGLIRVRDLKDDFYELDEANYCLVGSRTRRKFQLGDGISVQLKSADLMKKQIDFVVAGELTTFSSPFKERDSYSSRSGKSSNRSSSKEKSGSKKKKGFGGNSGGGKKKRR